MTSRREREVLRNEANVIKLTNYENINDILITKEKEKEKILAILHLLRKLLSIMYQLHIIWTSSIYFYYIKIS